MSLCCGRIIRMGPGGLTKLSEEFSQDCRRRGPGLNSCTPSPVRCVCFLFRDSLLLYSCSEHLRCVTLFPVSCLSDDKSRPMWGSLACSLRAWAQSRTWVWAVSSDMKWYQNNYTSRWETSFSPGSGPNDNSTFAYHRSQLFCHNRFSSVCVTNTSGGRLEKLGGFTGDGSFCTVGRCKISVIDIGALNNCITVITTIMMGIINCLRCSWYAWRFGCCLCSYQAIGCHNTTDTFNTRVRKIAKSDS